MKNLASLPGISPDGIKALRELNKKYESGEKVEPEVANAIKALSMANRVLNTVMNGGQVDPAFLKRIVDDLQKMEARPQGGGVKKIIKKKKLKIKNKL
jgi:hypothetical protein